MFKIGDSIRTKSRSSRTIITHIDNNSAGITRLWGLWETSSGGPLCRYATYAFEFSCEHDYSEYQYDPTQQGDKEDDI